MPSPSLGLRLRTDRVVPLVDGVVLGRASDCAVRVPEGSVSRHHCVVEVVGGRLFLRDLRSRLGTEVNGKPVNGRVELHAGDDLRIGNVRVGRVVGPDPTPSLVQILPSARSLGSLGSGSADPGDRLQALLEVSQLLGRPQPLEHLLDQVVELACRVFGGSGAVVLLVGPDGELAARSAKGANAHSRTIADWVLETRQAAVFADAGSDARSKGAESVMALAIRSCMAAPLIPHDRVVGVLYLDHRSEPHRFGPEDLAYLGAFANQVAIAVDNAWLRRDLEAAAAARATLQRFFPPNALAGLLASGGRLETIEAEVTALFCDIVDYTGISAQIGPREVITLLNRYFAAVSTVVFAYGGTLEKYVGDAVLAVWGAPLPCDDHADRAVAAALAIQAALGALDPPIDVHIGLNTGVVAAGNVGTENYLQYASIGDATNIASRVCGLAGGGEVVVTEAVWSRLSDPFPADAEQALVKGKPDPLTVYRWRRPARGVAEQA